YVIDDAVDATNLVNDPGRRAPEEVHVELIEIGGHAIHRGHGAKGANEFISATITHDADGLHRQEDRKGLPDLVILAGLTDFVEIDGVRLAQDVELFRGDTTRAADG